MPGGMMPHAREGRAGSSLYAEISAHHPHPHLVCIRCGRILDPDIPAVHDLPLQVVTTTGYEVVSHRLDLYGICPACKERASTAAVV